MGFLKLFHNMFQMLLTTVPISSYYIFLNSQHFTQATENPCFGIIFLRNKNQGWERHVWMQKNKRVADSSNTHRDRSPDITSSQRFRVLLLTSASRRDLLCLQSVWAHLFSWNLCLATQWGQSASTHIRGAQPSWTRSSPRLQSSDWWVSGDVRPVCGGKEEETKWIRFHLFQTVRQQTYPVSAYTPFYSPMGTLSGLQHCSSLPYFTWTTTFWGRSGWESVIGPEATQWLKR